MRILILGYAESIYIKNYIENILKDSNFDIFITLSDRNSVHREYYELNNVKVIHSKYNVPLLSCIPGIKSLINSIITMFMLYRKYDIIHVHFMSLTYVYAMILLKKNAKVVGTFWGDDIFCASEKELRLLGNTFKHFDRITLLTKRMLRRFHQIYSNTYDDKLAMVKFGVSGFKDISSVLENEGKAECKNYFNIGKQKTVISIGYNAVRTQQHLEVIKMLSTMPKETWKGVSFVFQMTYGGLLADYIAELEYILKEMDCKYNIITSFLDDIEIARLRIATDIFIHAQTSDAFSATIQECLYAGAVVLNPNWIQYDELREIGVDYIEYSNFEELPGIIRNLLSNPIESCETNKEKLSGITSWEKTRDDWLDLYKFAES